MNKPANSNYIRITQEQIIKYKEMTLGTQGHAWVEKMVVWS